MKSTNIYDWIDQNHDKQLTIADIDKLNPGDTVEVCMFDRNFEEYGMWDKYEESVGYDPEDILQYNKMTLKYKGNYTWDLIIMDCGTFEHPIHLNVEHLDTNWAWAEIDPKDSMVHITNNVFECGEEHNDWNPLHVHYNNFPKTTRVGWRGPAVLWEKVYDMPKIHWHHKK